MALQFYMNEHVPKPITTGLRIRAVDVLTAQEDSRAELEDSLARPRSRIGARYGVL